MKPVCVDCEVEFVPDKNGVYLAEMFQENKKVYRLWHSDMLKCPACDKKIILGTGSKPIAEHFEGQEDLFGKQLTLDEKVEELQKRGEVVVRNLQIKWR